MSKEFELTPRDEELALCIGFLKVGARVASDLRNAHLKEAPPEENVKTLAALVTLALQSFPDLQKANDAIQDLAGRCGFRLEERILSKEGHA